MVRLAIFKERCFIGDFRQMTEISLLRYTVSIANQYQAAVKLHGVFLSNSE